MSLVAPVSDANIAERAATAVIATGFRHVLALLSGIVIARGLGPAEFGNFVFLLASFAGVHALIDLGTSQAFYTLICRQAWSWRFFLLYGLWIAFQFILPFTVIGLLFPQIWLRAIWGAHGRDVIVMALVASFSQRVLWQATVQFGEAHRQTMRVQIVTLAIMGCQLAAVLLMQSLHILSVVSLFILTAASFAGGGLVVVSSMRRNSAARVPAGLEPVSMIVRELGRLTTPLMLPLALQTVNSFIEIWLLQTFGGAAQQAYYNIAVQYANVVLVFGLPAANVFWKEFASAHARGDDQGLKRIYVSGTRIMLVVATLVAGFGIFWATPIVTLLVGPAYRDAGPVFALTLTRAIFQCYGIVVTTALYATARMRLLAMFNFGSLALSLPGSLVGLWLLGLGAIGLAGKLLLLSAIGMPLCDLIMCRLYGWKTDNAFRIGVAAALMACGAMAYAATQWLFPGQPASLLPLAVGLVLYLLLAALPTTIIARRLGYLRVIRGAFGAQLMSRRAIEEPRAEP